MLSVLSPLPPNTPAQQKCVQQHAHCPHNRPPRMHKQGQTTSRARINDRTKQPHAHANDAHTHTRTSDDVVDERSGVLCGQHFAHHCLHHSPRQIRVRGRGVQSEGCPHTLRNQRAKHRASRNGVATTHTYRQRLLRWRHGRAQPQTGAPASRIHRQPRGSWRVPAGTYTHIRGVEAADIHTANPACVSVEWPVTPSATAFLATYSRRCSVLQTKHSKDERQLTNTHTHGCLRGCIPEMAQGLMGSSQR